MAGRDHQSDRRVLAYEPASRRRPFLALVFVCVVLAVCTLVWTQASRSVGTPSINSLNRGTANAILLALNQYERDNGRYPATLAELRSVYIGNVPPSLDDRGTAWFYQATTEGKGFKFGWRRGNDMCTIDEMGRVQGSTNPGEF